MNVREGPPRLAAGGPSTQAQGRVCPPRPGPKGNMSDSRLMMAKVSTERLRRDGFRRRPYVSNLSCLADRAERRGAGRRSLSLQRAPAVEPPTLTALFFPMSSQSCISGRIAAAIRSSGLLSRIFVRWLLLASVAHNSLLGPWSALSPRHARLSAMFAAHVLAAFQIVFFWHFMLR